MDAVHDSISPIKSQFRFRYDAPAHRVLCDFARNITIAPPPRQTPPPPASGRGDLLHGNIAFPWLPDHTRLETRQSITVCLRVVSKLRVFAAPADDAIRRALIARPQT